MCPPPQDTLRETTTHSGRRQHTQLSPRHTQGHVLSVSSTPGHTQGDHNTLYSPPRHTQGVEWGGRQGVGRKGERQDYYLFLPLFLSPDILPTIFPSPYIFLFLSTILASISSPLTSPFLPLPLSLMTSLFPPHSSSHSSISPLSRLTQLPLCNHPVCVPYGHHGNISTRRDHTHQSDFIHCNKHDVCSVFLRITGVCAHMLSVVCCWGYIYTSATYGKTKLS